MIQFCPKCRSFFGESTSSFCINDGTPLIKINSKGETWDKGIEFLESKRKLRKRKRRGQLLKKVFTLTMTIIIFTLIVFVSAVNIYIWVNSDQKNNDSALTGEQITNNQTKTESSDTNPNEEKCSDGEKESLTKIILNHHAKFSSDYFAGARQEIAHKYTKGDIEKIALDGHPTTHIEINANCKNARMTAKYKYSLNKWETIRSESINYYCHKTDVWKCLIKRKK